MLSRRETGGTVKKTSEPGSSGGTDEEISFISVKKAFLCEIEELFSLILDWRRVNGKFRVE
jgi:hypothetical protein